MIAGAAVALVLFGGWGRATRLTRASHARSLPWALPPLALTGLLLLPAARDSEAPLPAAPRLLSLLAALTRCQPRRHVRVSGR